MVLHNTPIQREKTKQTDKNKEKNKEKKRAKKETPDKQLKDVITKRVLCGVKQDQEHFVK